MGSPLFIRSVFSLLSSMCTIEGIIEYGKKYGYTSIGLVDKNVLSGAMPFKKACEKAGIKAVFGLEFEINIDERNFEMVLYAKNDDGFKNLMALSSYICTGDDKVIDIETLNKYRKNNILCLLSDSMPLTYAVDKQMDLEDALNAQEVLFGKDYVVGMVDHDCAMNARRDLQIKKVLKARGIPTIALSRTYYLNRDDYEEYEVLKCIRDKRTLDNDSSIYDSGRHFLDKNEMASLYEDDDIKNSDVLSSQCNVSMKYETSLPLYKTKNNVSSKDYLISLCKEGLKRRLKNNLNDTYVKRLEYELKVIIDMNFEDYFLVVYDFILFAKKNNIMVGPGRGSGVGSLVCYCLGITDLDPIKYGLFFERFLNPERISMPDIDTDFPDDRRDEVIEYVRDKYGVDHVAHIVTYGTLKAKQVLRDVGRVLDYSTGEIDSVCKLIPFAYDITLDKAMELNPIFKQKINSDEKFRRLYRISKKLEGFPRHESTHAAGIVMSEKPLEEVIPVTKIEQDIYSTQYTMEHLEEFGLIKMDFLGLRNLGIIAEIVDDINKKEAFNIKNIPLDDPKTFELIDNCNVLGVFQLESNGMQNLVRKMKPKNFEDIAVTIALFRPGPMENIPVYLENRTNPEKIEYVHNDLKPILAETYGIIVYQEQIMSIARTMAGFTYGKADILRRAMSKKKAEELEKLYPDFIDGCMKKGYSKDIAVKVYDLILKFANYGFNKSHSIAYGMVAYQMAYLKANYPLFFYKALLNGVTGSQTKTYDYISECQNIGQKVRGLSINNSEITYKIDNDCIIMPLSICKDVGMASASKIIEERNTNGRFDDFVDCIKRLTISGVDKNVLENLIYAGAFDEFKYSRHTMIEALPNTIKYANAHKGETSLMDGFDDRPLIKELNDDKMILAENEKNVLGFYFSFNPITEVKRKNNIVTDNLYNLANSEGYKQGFGLIKRVKSLRTKKGELMAFVDVIDDKGEISLAVMPNLYKLFSVDLVKGRYVLFEGKIEKQNSCLVKKLTFY